MSDQRAANTGQKMKDQMFRPKNAGLENSGPNVKAGNCRARI